MEDIVYHTTTDYYWIWEIYSLC